MRQKGTNQGTEELTVKSMFCFWVQQKSGCEVMKGRWSFLGGKIVQVLIRTAPTVSYSSLLLFSF